MSSCIPTLAPAFLIVICNFCGHHTLITRLYRGPIEHYTCPSPSCNSKLELSSASPNDRIALTMHFWRHIVCWACDRKIEKKSAMKEFYPCSFGLKQSCNERAWGAMIDWLIVLTGGEVGLCGEYWSWDSWDDYTEYMQCIDTKLFDGNLEKCGEWRWDWVADGSVEWAG